MDFTIRPTTEHEQMYLYAQSNQISAQTGLIGYLRADFGTSGNQFYSTWFDHNNQWKTDEFKALFDTLVNALREKGGLLDGREGMKAFCHKHPTSAFEGNYCTEYGFRLDTENYTLLLRCNPTKGDYNVYCYCHVRKWLDDHMTKAKNGIVFREVNFGKELFRIPDGGAIELTDAQGNTTISHCRYINESHLEVGGILYHNNQYAEILHRLRYTVRPANQA